MQLDEWVVWEWVRSVWVGVRMTVRMDERKRGRRRGVYRQKKVNTKAMKILEVLSVLMIVMAQGCKEGRMGWGTGWRGFWRLMMQGRAEEKGGPYLRGPGLFCTMVNHMKWTLRPWFSMYLGQGPEYGVGFVYHSTPDPLVMLQG